MRARPFLSATSTIETLGSLLEGAFLPSARARHVRVVVVWSPHARFRVNYFVTRSRDEKRKEKREKNLCLWHLGKKKKEFFCLVSFINATEARARATQTHTHTHREREREIEEKERRTTTTTGRWRRWRRNERGQRQQ